jgi:hypothetical protein
MSSQGSEYSRRVVKSVEDFTSALKKQQCLFDEIEPKRSQMQIKHIAAMKRRDVLEEVLQLKTVVVMNGMKAFNLFETFSLLDCTNESVSLGLKIPINKSRFLLCKDLEKFYTDTCNVLVKNGFLQQGQLKDPVDSKIPNVSELKCIHVESFRTLMQAIREIDACFAENSVMIDSLQQELSTLTRMIESEVAHLRSFTKMS